MRKLVLGLFSLLLVSCMEQHPAEQVSVSSALVAPPFWCGYEMGSSQDVPDFESDCHWTAPSGLPDYVQKYHGAAILPFPGQTLPCEGQKVLSDYSLVVAQTVCPHTFVPISTPNTFNPWTSGSAPATGPGSSTTAPYAPTLSPPFFSTFYPNAANFGPTNIAQYVTSCTTADTPRGSIDVYLSSNVDNNPPVDGNCARITPPTHDGSAYFIDWRGFLARGWRTNANGVEKSIKSINVGPDVEFAISSNAKVDFTDAWLCRLWPTNSRCKYANTHGATFSLEMDHYFAASPPLEANFRPWSMWFLANY